MRSVQEREQNLFNATDTMAQFYEEIESFFDILTNKMERAGFTASEERLRPGTFSLANLSRRLVGSINVIYVKGVAAEAEEEELEGEESAEEDEQAKEKQGKAEILITDELRIPFVYLSLFKPKMIPTVHNLTSPMLYAGAIGNPKFIDKKTRKPAQPDNRSLALSSIVNMRVRSDRSVGDPIMVPCWRPKPMRRYELEMKLLGFDRRLLLEIDSQEKIGEIAEKLASFCTA